MERRLKKIASRDNALFKTLRQLARNASAEREEKLAMLEGVHLCEACLASGTLPRYCAVAQSSLAHPEVAQIIAKLGERLPSSRLPSSRLPSSHLVLLDDALFGALSQVEHGVGILFVIDVPQVAETERIEASCVLLDRIQDPGNVGSILRSAAAAGIGEIYASRGCASAWSPKVLRAGMGAHFHLRLHEDCDLKILAARTSIPRIATSPSATHSIYDADLTGNIAWTFGHEGRGLDPELMRDAIALAIPQPGGGESLNVAAAAAICFFEQVRQRASVNELR